jgi:three-Cys-motif partner protein
VARNFHRSPFDEGTQIKLELFRDYTREWLPVWLSQARPGVPITVADFFAGPGQDSDGTPGSPLIVLGELRQSSELIQRTGAKVRLLLNEASKTKAASLRATLESQSIPSDLCTCDIRNLAFEEAFDEVYSELRAGPNLLILDQQGMKEISDRLFNQILELSRTDFLFFIASSSIRRFESHPYFQKHLRIPKGTITGATFNDTHRAVTRYYRDLAKSKGQQYFLGSFSIKKGSNIYGLIFGSGHPLGLEKFLRVCWKADPERGEANFDIDEDRLDSSTPHLFPEMDQPKKLTMFQRSARSKIMNGELETDRDVYLDSLQEGFLPSDGRAVLRALMKARQVRVAGGQPRVSKAGYDEPRTLEVLTDGAV